jgi:hypothetical protein
MRARRIILAMVSSLCLLWAHPGAASAAEENPYWQSDTNLPADTITGEWSVSEDGGSAQLTISGANLPAQNTRFVAGWVTPWVASDSEWAEQGELDLLLSPTTSASLVGMVRSRLKGERWRPWFKNRLPYEEGLGLGGVGAWGGGSSVLSLGPPSKIQYEWRLVGEIDGPARIEASIELSLN